ncbi:hypothetical protein ETD86_42505 [Nonomuraea turkmeniaca]|uniref:Uncharacterized protein n=1 Tax=Nonomuraea turkmeniaca TaxID=103838 RepID=A0A5S4F162_9ACTN|nr:hypothetical protein [Nonomuraea turkmeniaca]TMR09710.1 hypothetical protein ETD86_42505 [Nonomuraea turkmeniaca]
MNTKTPSSGTSSLRAYPDGSEGRLTLSNGLLGALAVGIFYNIQAGLPAWRARRPRTRTV